MSSLKLDNSPPKVSVVIPVFNGAGVIGETIESVLNQTFRNHEIIVVDDGSTDGSGEVLKQFSKHITLCRQQNQGVAITRNRGISIAKGEWIAFLDQDDLWYPQKLATQIDYVEKYPGVDFFYSDMNTIDEKGNILNRNYLVTENQQPKELTKLSFSLIFDNCPFPFPSTVLAKKEVLLKAGGFNPLFRANHHEDVELFVKVARITPIHFIPESLIAYRVRQSASPVTSWEWNWLVLLKTLWEMWRDEPEKQILLVPYFAKYSSDYGTRCLRSGDYRTARQFFRQAFSYKPLAWRNLARWALSYVPGIRNFYIHENPHAQ